MFAHFGVAVLLQNVNDDGAHENEGEESHDHLEMKNYC